MNSAKIDTLYKLMSSGLMFAKYEDSDCKCIGVFSLECIGRDQFALVYHNLQDSTVNTLLIYDYEFYIDTIHFEVEDSDFEEIIDFDLTPIKILRATDMLSMLQSIGINTNPDAYQEYGE